MLKDGLGTLTTACKDVNRNVPYFEEQPRYGQSSYNETLNHWLFRKYDTLGRMDVEQKDKISEYGGHEEIPDGAIKVEAANKHLFRYGLSVSDGHDHAYHRNNGVTKLGIVDVLGGQSNDKTNY